MHLIVLILGFMFFPKGYAMKCMKCMPDANGSPCKTAEPIECGAESTCLAATVMYKDMGGKNMTMKSCGAKMCASGSMNVGSKRAYATCCKTALCNSKYPSPTDMSPNKMTCYTCKGEDCSEMAELKCSGTEDRCMSGYEVMKDTQMKMKVMGCAQESMCMPSINIGVMEVMSATCCEGNMCNRNGAANIAVSLLLLVAPVVSFALFN